MFLVKGQKPIVAFAFTIAGGGFMLLSTLSFFVSFLISFFSAATYPDTNSSASGLSFAYDFFMGLIAFSLLISGFLLGSALMFWIHPNRHRLFGIILLSPTSLFLAGPLLLSYIFRFSPLTYVAVIFDTSPIGSLFFFFKGFLIGPILGFLGGIAAFLWKPLVQTRNKRVEFSSIRI